MSGSRKSLRKGTIFNPRASNEWSKDDSKFGQKMLEKMGWKQGQGIGLNNQGISENIKVRLKLDNKGLGYQIKEDQWLEVRSEFSDLLSELSQGVEDEDEAVDKDKKSLEAVSQSCRTRVHYHKFTHGKDIARYKKEDLKGILGMKEKDESAILENKEFIKCGNMNEYFKSKMKSKKSDTNDSNLPSADHVPKVDDQSNDTEVNHILKENTSKCDSKLKSNSRKRKTSTKNLDHEYGNEEMYENKLTDGNSTNQCHDETEKIGSDDTGPTRRKKKRNLKTSLETDNPEDTDQRDNFNVENAPDENLGRKKSLQKDEEIEKSSEQTNELINEKTADQNIEKPVEDNVVKKCRNKKRDKKCSIESKNDASLDEKILTNSLVEYDNESANDQKFGENNDVHLPLENSRERKKKKKSEETMACTSAENNKNKDGIEEKIENDGNETRRKKKHHALEQSILNDDISSTTISLKVIDDSVHELKKIKSKSKKKTDWCLSQEKNKIVSTGASEQENNNEKIEALNTITKNSADFMKSIIDYNSCNNVEDFISNFEKNREELMSKYREKYKQKYLISSSDKIKVYGDEFDGRKLDCKKPKAENTLDLKSLDRKNMSKADRIVAKARLLQMIKDETVTHDFEGSNLKNILGYGNVAC